MNPKDESRERENLDSFNRLADQQKSLAEQDMKRYRYYTDNNLNEYRWYTHRQANDKWLAEIVKYSYRKMYGKKHRYPKSTKERYFAKKKTAISWLRKCLHKAMAHQTEVNARASERRQKRQALKPQYTETQKQVMKYTQKIEHEKRLIAKSKSKIKRCTTLIKNHEKRIKYFTKKLEKVELIVEHRPTSVR